MLKRPLSVSLAAALVWTSAGLAPCSALAQTRGRKVILSGAAILPPAPLPAPITLLAAPGALPLSAVPSQAPDLPGAAEPVQAAPSAFGSLSRHAARADRLEASAPAAEAAAAQSAFFDAAALGPPGGVPSGPPRTPSSSDKELLELREKVEADTHAMVRSQLGGDLGRRDLFRPVADMLRRLQDANGIDPDSVSLHLGGSFVPNAFTTITGAEIDFLKKKGRLRATFKNSNVFVSLGLIEGYRGKPDAALAFVLAHELAHNRLGHLKTIFGSMNMLGHLLEFDADVEALRMLARAGYDPREALDALELIDARIETLAREYPLFRREESELQQMLARWRDIHPPHAQRRAHLEDHLEEALEIYARSPSRGRAADALERVGAALEARPVRNTFVRFEEKARGVLQDEGKPYYEKIVALEALIAQRIREREEAAAGVKQRFVAIEDQLIVENVFRRLSAEARGLDDLDQLHQMYRRLTSALKAPNFPSAKAESYVVAQQIKTARRLLGERADVSRLDPYIGRISPAALRALFLFYLRRTSSPAAWDDALKYLGMRAQALGVGAGGVDPGFAQGLAKALLEKTMSLAAPVDKSVGERVASAVERLLTQLPATLLTASAPDELSAPWYLSTHLKGEILDLFFRGKLADEKAWGLVALSHLVEGRSRAQALARVGKPDAFKEIHSAGVMAVWNERYYRAASPEISKAGKARIKYERLRTQGLVIPAAPDLLASLFLYPQKAADDENNRHSYVPIAIPETISELILMQTHGWQERFWEQVADRFLEGFVNRREFEGSAEIVREGVARFGELQSSLAKRSRGLSPIVAMLAGIERSLMRVKAGSQGAADAKALSQIADVVISKLINEHVHRQLNAARDSEHGLVKAELDALNARVLELDKNYASFNTTERLRLLARVLAVAVRAGKDYSGLTAFLHSMMHWKTSTSGSGASANFFARENRRHFRRAGLGAEFSALPESLGRTVTSGALGLMADPASTVEQLLGASLAAFYWNGLEDIASVDREPTNQTLAVLLLEQAARRIRAPADARLAADFLVKAHDLDPLYLSYVSRAQLDTKSRLYGAGVADMMRFEVIGALAARKQPFRERDAAVARALLQAVERAGGMPADAASRLKLLDWAGRVGDYDPWVEDRILAVARAEPQEFLAWAKQDEAWTRRIARRGKLQHNAFFRNLKQELTRRLEQTLGIPGDSVQLPELKPTALRIIRNPVKRAELYRALVPDRFAERARYRYWRDRELIVSLGKAYWKAWKFFDRDFLRRAARETSPDSRVVMALEEAAAAADRELAKAESRWNAGREGKYDRQAFLREDDAKTARWRRMWMREPAGPAIPAKWRGSSESEKDDMRAVYRRWVSQRALNALWQLAEKYSGFIDPELGRIVDSFPEPSRVRDDLLERLARARALTPERIGLMESYKSYRFPNPLRFAEKQFMDIASVQMAKLSPAQRVDLILHMGGVSLLPEAKLKELEDRMLGADRKAFARTQLNIYSFHQLLRYVDQLHPDDKELFVKSMFYGKGSIAERPEQVLRLFRRTISGRQLPPLVRKILFLNFEALNPAERVRMITQLIKSSTAADALDGPDVTYLALMASGITGAKLGQVLASHKGLLPPEYAAKLHGFKDEAQSLEKALVFSMLEQRLALLRAGQTGREDVRAGQNERRAELEQAAALLYPHLNPPRRSKYVREVLALERITTDGGIVADIKELGREMGSGSVKVAYKIYLKDGSRWVAKIRRPGATVKVEREFEILNAVTKKLTGDKTLGLPNVEQLVDEVQTLVRAELDFVAEAEKGRITRANVASRGALESLAKKGGAVIVPRTHPEYLDEDVVLEQYFDALPFKKLPSRHLWRPTKRSVSKAILDEAAQQIVLDEYMDPDRHDGNVLTRTGLRLQPSKAVWIDLGQSVAIPIALLKPLMKAGLAARGGRPQAAAANLAEIFALAPGQTRADLEVVLARRLAEPTRDVMQTLLESVVKAEGRGFLVRKDYAALEKAMLLLDGYTQYLPVDYFIGAFERALALRVLRSDKRAFVRLVRHRLAEIFLGADRYAELSAEIDRI